MSATTGANPAENPGQDPVTDRRRFLATAGAAAAGAAWVVPTVVSTSVAAAATQAPAASTAVAVGQFFAPRVWTTTDAGADFAAAGPVPGDAYAVATNGAGRWVAVGTDAAWFSDDTGTTWTAATTPVNFDGRSVIVDGSGPGATWWAVGRSSPFVYSSTDGGATWVTGPGSLGSAQDGIAIDSAGRQLSVGPIDAFGLAPVWGDFAPYPAGWDPVAIAALPSGLFVAVGPTAAWWIQLPCPCPSPAFTAGAVPANWQALSVACDGVGRFVAVGRDASNTALGGAWFSTDGGQTWTSATTPPSTPAFGVATNGTGTWVAVGSAVPGGGSWFSTDDGVTWQQSTTPLTGLGTGVAFDRLLP